MRIKNWERTEFWRNEDQELGIERTEFWRNEDQELEQRGVKVGGCPRRGPSRKNKEKITEETEKEP
jgi:hypothetical protein